MSDILERLDAARAPLGADDPIENLMLEAADEIEGLRARLAAAITQASESRRDAQDSVLLIDRIEHLAAHNITGCGTCYTIINEIRKAGK